MYITTNRPAKGAIETTYNYAYDAASNRSSKTINADATNYIYNSLDQLISDGTISYEYDYYGNLLREKNGAQIKREYSWDAENHLISANTAVPSLIE